jgi:pimeloyl-ACP methyl ester carboxylesterase
MDVKHVKARGVDFAYLDAGPPDSPLALCLHGFPDHAPTFAPLLEDLAGAGYHAVAPWMRGYAPTAIPSDGAYASGALALDAIALADELAGSGPAVLIGHDWGAVAAYPAAAYKPGRFQRLVTLAVPPPVALAGGFLRPEQLKRSWYMFFFQHPLSDMVVQNDDFAFIDMLWRDWSPGYSPDPEFMAELKRTLGSPGTLGAALGYYRATLGSAPPDPALAKVQAAGPVTIPTLYMHGSDDGCMGADLVAASDPSPHFPGGIEVEIVPGAGHFLHLERPAEVNARILRFLAG